MISRETENVKSSEEIESAFRALSAENKPYVTKEELYQVRHTPFSTVYKCDWISSSSALILTDDDDDVTRTVKIKTFLWFTILSIKS